MPPNITTCDLHIITMRKKLQYIEYKLIFEIGIKTFYSVYVVLIHSFLKSATVY